MRLALVLTVSLLSAAPASADVIDSTWRPPACPPLACAPGATPAPSGSHSGCSPGCAPAAACENDGECAEPMGEGATCVETRFCLGERFASRLGPQTVVLGECAADGSCPEGECSVTRRCTAPPPRPAPATPEATTPSSTPPAPPATVPEPRANGGRGCAATPWASASWLACAIVPACILLVRRRTR